MELSPQLDQNNLSSPPTSCHKGIHEIHGLQYKSVHVFSLSNTYLLFSDNSDLQCSILVLRIWPFFTSTTQQPAPSLCAHQGPQTSVVYPKYRHILTGVLFYPGSPTQVIVHCISSHIRTAETLHIRYNRLKSSVNSAKVESVQTAPQLITSSKCSSSLGDALEAPGAQEDGRLTKIGGDTQEDR